MPGITGEPWIQPGGIKHHGDTAVELEYYFNRVSNGTAKRMGSHSHQLGTKTKQPLLKKGRVNRILFYIGAFNPPHRGHMIVLHHGFRECGEDFNMVGALVLLKGDNYLERKNFWSDRNLLLDSRERHALWSTDVEFPDWAWTLSEDDAYVYKDDASRVFWKEVPRLAKADGFDVEFVRLLGPDNFEARYDKSFEFRGHSYDTTLVSTAAREVNDYNHISGPRRLPNCSIWEPVASKKETVRRVTQSPSWLYTDGQPAPVPTSASPQQNETRIWRCHFLADPKINVRFLYTPPAVPDNGSTEMVSSTKIHAAITTATKAESAHFIDEYALGSTYLKQQLARREDGTHAKQLELQKIENEIKHLAFQDVAAGHVDECYMCKKRGCNCDYQQRLAKRRIRQQLMEAGPAFEETIQLTFRTREEMKKANHVSGKNATSEEEETEVDMAFEDIMRLRVPMKTEEVLTHQPEYRNANR